VKDNAPIQTLLTGVIDMIPVISFVGSSNSGKTTLVEQVIRILTEKGLRISLIKHDAHGFEIDHEGKDTWRHKQAGAVRVLISSPAKYAMISDGEADLGDMLYMAGDGDIDLIVIEGTNHPHCPR
jgi:molybdopterin-guanine dinucleotide biosynthesis protein B